MITLPNEVVPAVQDITAYHFLIQGDPGIGKSGLLASIPDYLLIDPEDKMRGYPGLKTVLRNWKDHLDLPNVLARAPRDLYAGIGLDSLNVSYDHCTSWIMTNNKFSGVSYSHPGEAPQGQAWNRITAEFLRWLRDITILGYHIVATCHTNITEVKTRNVAYNRWIPAFPGGSPTSTYFGVIKAFDIVGFMCIEDVVKPPTKQVFGKTVVDVRADVSDLVAEESRVIHFDESPYWLANNRGGQLPDTVVLTNRWQDDWRLIVQAWGTGAGVHGLAEEEVETSGGQQVEKEATDGR